MSKSQGTYSKKEKEKKKQLKRKEKEEKREERKANYVKGKSLEDMIAYVDENGQLTDTPPDPTKRKVINLDDIKLGARKPEIIDPADLIRRGNVTFYNTEKGYGFIKDERSQESLFFHVNGLLSEVKERDKVSFEVEMGQKGKVAVKVTLV